MAITELNTQYFQKSKAFLFPILSIKPMPFAIPTQTYIAWKGKYDLTDHRLICLYDTSPNIFYSFESGILRTNTMFEKRIDVGKKESAFIFNLRPHSDDWRHFLTGKYSRFSVRNKQCIRNFFTPDASEWEKMETYIYPEKNIGKYAELLFDEKDRIWGEKQLLEIISILRTGKFDHHETQPPQTATGLNTCIPQRHPSALRKHTPI